MIVIFMFDKNKNFEKYFFNQIVDFDEATLLSPNIGGNKTPKLEKCELKLKISELNQFCSENQLSENILFLASVNIALTKFNFSSKNLIFHENNIPFACIFENRGVSVKDYLDDFIAAKRIEGRSEKTLEYYKSVIKKMVDSIDNSICIICTQYESTVKS